MALAERSLGQANGPQQQAHHDETTAWRARAPAITPAAWRGLERTLQHPHAPRWNQTIGDRVGERELACLAEFRAALASRPLESERLPSATISGWIESLRGRLWRGLWFGRFRNRGGQGRGFRCG